MNRANGPVDRITMALGIALLAAVAGCVGYVDDDGDYGGAVVVPGPDFYLFGGGYDRGRDVRDYSHRGHESRAATRPESHHAPARSGGGEHGGKR